MDPAQQQSDIYSGPATIWSAESRALVTGSALIHIRELKGRVWMPVGHSLSEGFEADAKAISLLDGRIFAILSIAECAHEFPDPRGRHFDFDLAT
jgi:hypothetical protein